MNELTEALAKQAAEYAIEFATQDQSLYIPKFIERFAEMIVFECVKAVMDGTKEGDHYAQRIEQHFDHSTDGVLHFGVEE